MFNKESFSKILINIYKSYNNQREFANATGVNRAYLSQYMNMKLDNPPTPKILMGISNASKGLTTYNELMNICGYLNPKNSEQIIASKCFENNLYILEKYHLSPNDLEYLKKILIERNETISSITLQLSEFAKYIDISSFDTNLTIKDLYNDIIRINENISNELIDLHNSILETNNNDYFEFVSEDDAMFPLLDIGDIALVYKQNTIEDDATLLINIDNKNTIRKFILSKDKKYYSLVAMNRCYKDIDISINDLDKIKILGRVIESKNKSAFKKVKN